MICFSHGLGHEVQVGVEPYYGKVKPNKVASEVYWTPCERTACHTLSHPQPILLSRNPTPSTSSIDLQGSGPCRRWLRNVNKAGRPSTRQEAKRPLFGIEAYRILAACMAAVV